MKWKRRSSSSQRSTLSFRLLGPVFFLLFLFIILYRRSPNSLSQLTTAASLRHGRVSPCGAIGAPFRGERFLWYAPHSGFSNQLSEFRNAALMAAILNRTLIVPPILDHHAVALGSCPKFRVLSPNELRIRVWNHSIELLRTGRYVSMADILDLSSWPSSVVPTIDFRDFVSKWCDVDLSNSCLNDTKVQSSMLDNLKQCGSLLSGFEGSVDDCSYSVGEDCRTTVWTYQNNGEDNTLDAFQPDEQLRLKKKITYVRHRRNVYKSLGPGSKAHSYTVLAFGSLFTAPYKGSELYIDIHKSKADSRMQSIIENVEFIPFAPEIRTAALEFVQKIIKQPFLCAQLRLLDGQFKNHRKATFSALQQKIDGLRKSGSVPVHIFIMTDLPESNWSGTYLGDLARDTGAIKLHFLKEGDDHVRQIAKKVASASKHSGQPSSINNQCPDLVLPDVLLYLEESICSCGPLGFVGTAGSTIAESIELVRKHGVCLGKT